MKLILHLSIIYSCLVASDQHRPDPSPPFSSPLQSTSWLSFCVIGWRNAAMTWGRKNSSLSSSRWVILIQNIIAERQRHSKERYYLYIPVDWWRYDAGNVPIPLPLPASLTWSTRPRQLSPSWQPWIPTPFELVDYCFVSPLPKNVHCFNERRKRYNN
jgi:hypothetical protein